MKEIIIKIRRMSEENLKKFDGGRWSEAYEVSTDDFATFWKVHRAIRIGDIIGTIKKSEGDI